MRQQEAKVEQIARTPAQIGASLRRFRRLSGLSQTELGSKAALRQATISAIEGGEPATQLQTLTDVLAALGLELVVRHRTTSSETIEDLF
jgi:HTH-type transcriptional regulator/antitoxin HipB